MTHHLDIVGESTADVVVHAGGWIYDCTTAGWQVTVFVPEGDDPRALSILGADHEVLERVGCALVGPVRPFAALGMSAALRSSDPWAGAIVIDAMDGGRGDVTLWGKGLGAASDPRLRARRHRLSVAARAFKRHALAAVCGPEVSPGHHEHLHSSIAQRPATVPGLIYAG